MKLIYLVGPKTWRFAWSNFLWNILFSSRNIPREHQSSFLKTNVFVVDKSLANDKDVYTVYSCIFLFYFYICIYLQLMQEKYQNLIKLWILRHQATCICFKDSLRALLLVVFLHEPPKNRQLCWCFALNFVVVFWPPFLSPFMSTFVLVILWIANHPLRALQNS